MWVDEVQTVSPNLEAREGPRVIPTCLVYMTSSFDDLFVVNCLCTCIVYMYQLIGVGNYN